MTVIFKYLFNNLINLTKLPGKLFFKLVNQSEHAPINKRYITLASGASSAMATERTGLMRILAAPKECVTSNQMHGMLGNQFLDRLMIPF